jgi:hypothetical protein
MKELWDAIKECSPYLVYGLALMIVCISLLCLNKKLHDNFKRELHEARIMLSEKKTEDSAFGL